jgi:hypothetical protein
MLDKARRNQPRVLFVTDLWGYGSVTMAMAIAEELEGRATRLFAGTGPRFELARRAAVFDRLVPVDTTANPVAEELDRALGACHAVVSVMNRRVARRAALRRIPCLYVDSQHWMHPAPPDLPPAVAYCQEHFPAAEEPLGQRRRRLDRPETVGPLVALPTRSRSNEPDAVMVNFGGLSASPLEPRTLVAYADGMAQCTLRALDRWPGRVVVTAGSHVLDRLDVAAMRSIRPRVELADLSHDAYLAELRRSRLLISSAGMHAVLEAFAWGVPCLCLPSHNLGQVLALQVLERHDVARALDWGQIYGLTRLDPADEAYACEQIGTQITRFRGDPIGQAILVGHLRSLLYGRHLPELQQRQAGFFAELGERGAPRVAAMVAELMDTTMSFEEGA